MANSERLQAAFDEMKRTEMLLDDMDYVTNSPRLQRAMDAAEKWRKVLDEEERGQR